MESRTWTRSIALTMFAALAMPVSLAAQDAAKKTHPHQYHHYQLVSADAFGGPGTGLQNPGLPRAGVLSNRGTLVGWGLTPAIDPYCGFGGICNAGDALQYQDGVTTDLGRVPGGIDSQANWISGSGVIAGLGDNGIPDPLAGFPIPQLHGLIWENGVMTDLGSLPEGGYLVFPDAVNDRGEVVGFAQNTVPDANAILTGYGYQTRAFYWHNGSMQDLGTLGTGTDALALVINQRGQVVGESYTNSVPSPFCSGLGFALTTGTFIWDKKDGMRDIGTLGGTCTVAWDLNNRGRIVGESSRLGDPTNIAFVWDRTTGMTELRTGGYGGAFAVNEGGEVAGYGETSDGQTSAILWREREGKWHTTYLGRLHPGDCALGVSINRSAQVVGVSGPNSCSTILPFLWEDGGPMVDLNTLVPSGSGIQLTEAVQINDRGEIAAQGPDSGGNNHAVVLIPCDENHADVQGCDYSMVDASTDALVNPAHAIPQPAALSPRSRMPGMLNRFRFPKGRPVLGDGAMPASTARPAVPANAATTDWLADRLPMPKFQQPTAFCAITNGVLTGSCVAVSATFACSVLSNVCPQGESATSSGTTDCNGSGIAVSTTKCDSPGFSLSGSSALTPGTISEGASASSTLSVTAFGGFSGPVAFTCAVSPTPALAPTCSVSPSSVTPGTNATLTVRTTAPTSALLPGADSGLRYAFWLPVFGLALTGAGFGSKRKGRKTTLIGYALTCMLLSGLVCQLACGSHSNPGTPAGLYIITVTGTDSSGTLVNSTTLAPLTVQ